MTRGPGATQASVGVHTAFQDSTPMILFVGDVGSDFRDREAFQEVDFAAMFAPLAKWAARIDSVERIPEYVNRAFTVAMSGRRGPVVLALPEDLLTRDRDGARTRGMYTPVARRARARARWSACASCSPRAKRPLVVLGGSGWTKDACDGHPQVRRRPTTCRSPAPSASRTSSTTATPTTWATWAWASTRSSPSACAPRTCCSSSARAWAR